MAKSMIKATALHGSTFIQASQAFNVFNKVFNKMSDKVSSQMSSQPSIKTSNTLLNLPRAAVAALCCLMSASVFAEAPSADVGSFESNVEYGILFNGGMAIGGDAALELSVGTVHGNSSVDDFTANVTQGGGAGLALGNFNTQLTGVIFNGGLVIGGDMCAKTAVASVGASTCSYGTSGTYSAESETN